MNERCVHLHYTLQAQPQAPLGLGHPLFALLDALAREGSIQHAARALGASYRHVWGQLRQWEQTMGEPLVVWTQGQPARLTAAGERLRLAHEQLRTRLAPQLDALRSGLDQVLAAAGGPRPTLQVAGVHEPVLAALRELAAAHVGLDIVLHMGEGAGDLGALQALHEGRCDAALLRLPEGEAGRSMWQALQQAVSGLHAAPDAQPWALLPLGRRALGWMFRMPDPAWAGVHDLATLSQCLQGMGHPRLVRWPALDSCAGWQAAWWTPLAGGQPAAPGPVAHHVLEAAGCVATATADLAVGTAAAARALGLGFVPVTHEVLALAVPAAVRDGAALAGRHDGQPAVDALARLLALLAQPAWREAMEAVPGVDAAAG